MYSIVFLQRFVNKAGLRLIRVGRAEAREQNPFEVMFTPLFKDALKCPGRTYKSLLLQNL